MTLCGLWHGAAWTFVLWGGYHGMLLAISPRPPRQIEQPRKRVREFRIKWTGQRIIMTVITFHIVCFGWLIFRAENIGHLIQLLSNAWTLSSMSGLNLTEASLFAILVTPLLAIELFSTLTGQRDMRHLSPHIRSGLVFIMFYIALIGQPSDLAAFIYFQF